MPNKLARAEPSPLALIRELAVDAKVEPAKLRELMELQDRWMAKEAHAKFWQAMARLSTKLPRIKKRGKIGLGVGKGEIPYARYEDIDAVCRPLLASEGISVAFSTRVGPTGGVVMILTVSHADGHSETSERPAPPDAGPGRNGTQAQGSGESYARRYLFSAFFNLVTEGADDDGRATGFITEQQRESIGDLIHQFGDKWTPERQGKFLAFMNAPSVREINASDFKKAVNFLEEKARQVR